VHLVLPAWKYSCKASSFRVLRRLMIHTTAQAHYSMPQQYAYKEDATAAVVEHCKDFFGP